MKLINYLLISILLIGVAYGVTGQVINFTGQYNPFNITFTGNQNYTYWLSLPNYAYNTQFNFTINFTSGYRDCKQEFTNITNSNCSTSNEGNYSTLNTSLTEWAGGKPYYYAWDGDHTTQAQCAAGGTCNLSMVYTIPNVTYNIAWQVVSGNGIRNTTIPNACKLNGKLFLRILSNAFSTTHSGYCYEGGDHYTLLYTTAAGGYNIYEESIIWNFNVSNLTTKIYVDYNKIFEYTFNNTEQKNVTNNTFFNPVLSSKCSCQNCTLSNNNCLIPINFYSDNLGVILVNLTNASYAYGIDNCSSRFGIPSNGTALNVTTYDSLTLAPIKGNMTSIFNYLSSNYSFVQYYKSNYSICIYPAWFNTSVTYTVQYSFGDNINLYNSPSVYLNNITQLLPLYMEAGTGTAVTATVYDNINNIVEGAYITVQRYDLATGNYLLVGSYSTNFEGQAKLYLTLNSIYYRFLIYYPSGNIVLTTNPTFIYSTSINFQINTIGTVAEDYFESKTVYTDLTYNNNTKYFTFTVSDTNNVINQSCLKIRTNSYNDSGWLNISCVTGTSATINLGIPAVNGTTYYVKGFIYDATTGNEILKEEMSASFAEVNPFSNMGLFAAFILTIIFGFVITWSLPIGIIMIPLPTLFLSMVGILNLNPAIPVTLEIIALVLAIMINRRG